MRSVDNCDIQTSIFGTILCDFSAIPSPDSTYNAILCSAMLEHVPYPDVMAEAHRLLVAGGTLVVSVPLLQPVHPTPFDFRRYVRTGLEHLGDLAGFRVFEMRAALCFAQTVAWLLRVHLAERSSGVGKGNHSALSFSTPNFSFARGLFCRT